MTVISFMECPNQMNLKHSNSSDNLVEIGINLKDYYPSVEWDIIKVPAERHEKYYECCPDEFYAGELIFFSYQIKVDLIKERARYYRNYSQCWLRAEASSKWVGRP